MQANSSTAWAMGASLWTHRALILSLVKRDIRARYRGTVMGVAWALLHPLVMLAIYTFVFGEVFQARWGQNARSDREYALILFIGLIVFQIFADCINRAPTLITANAVYVKKILFPLEILPWTTIGPAIFQATISLCVWLVAYVILIGAPPPTSLLIPLVLVSFVLFIAGVSWWLASLGVFMRDIAQVTGILTSILFFLSPIFYPISAVPERFRVAYVFNPISAAVEAARDVLVHGRIPDPVVFGISTVVAIAVAWSGFAWFQTTRRGFADVL